MPDLFDVIADPTRRELLRALLDASSSGDGPGEASVGELVGRLSLSQPTVSKHLRTLREFSIVTVREQGQHRYYRLEPDRLLPVAEWLGEFVRPAADAAAVAPTRRTRAEEAVLAVVEAAPARPLPAVVRVAAVRVGAIAAVLVARSGR